jgi:hypothetical protein
VIVVTTQASPASPFARAGPHASSVSRNALPSRAQRIHPIAERAGGFINQWCGTGPVESEHDVGLVFVDAKANAYLFSITPRADVRRDPAQASEIWKATDDAWWQGPEDPNVCVLRIHPLTAELWDGPSSNAVAAFEFVKAQLTGILGPRYRALGSPAFAPLG